LNTNCKICNSPVNKVFSAKVLNKYDVAYFYCSNCGFLCTEEPHWLEEAYKTPINIYDTGVINRNLYLAKMASVLLIFRERQGRFLDYAGGYGLFTRLMRDIGFDFYWQDQYTTNLFARGFEYKGDKVDMVTCFEAFEHFVDPNREIEKLLSMSKNIFFTTELLPKGPPKPNDWWYYGLEHGQHVSFYSSKTLRYVANRYELNLYSYKGVHLLTQHKYDLNSYEFLMLFSKVGGFGLVKLLMNSRTMDDMNYLKTIKKGSK
jgi:hypothetical protein